MKRFGFLIALILGISATNVVYCPLFAETTPIAYEKKSEPILKRTILDRFFRALLEESQGGYVLYGNKPMCTEGILPKEANLLMLGGALHKRSVALKEGLRIWETVSKNSQNKYVIQSYDTLSYGWRELVLINREEFQKTVSDNLALFQYVLGPQVTPQKLFEHMSDRRNGFSSILKNDKVLTGILLGFGTENALYGSRKEIISESLSSTEIVPFKSVRKKMCDQTFGTTREEELTELKKKFFRSIDLVERQTPLIPWFGCLKSATTEKLLNGYVKTQKKVRKVLDSKDFLEKIMGYLISDKTQSSIAIQSLLSEAYCDLKGIDWSSIIARSIAQGIPNRDPEWIDSLIQGMQSADQGHSPMNQEQWDRLLDDFAEVDKTLHSVRNFAKADDFFSSLDKRGDLTCLVERRLYYRTTEQAGGDVRCPGSAVARLKFAISNPCAEIPSKDSRAEEDAIVDLSECVSGFAAGVRGMAIGEEREIFIHPAFAYGESCNITPNICLTAHVKLLQVIDQGSENELVLEPLDLPSESFSETELSKRHQILRCQIARELGIRTWSHFKGAQNEGYSLNSLLDAFRVHLKNGQEELSSYENDLLTSLQWKIYYL